MFRADTTHTAWVECRPIGSDRDKKSVIRIKHLPCHNLEPFSSDTTSINPFLAMEPDVQFSVFDLVAILAIHGLLRIKENLVAADVELQGWMRIAAALTCMKAAVKVVALIIEFQHLGVVDQKRKGAAH